MVSESIFDNRKVIIPMADVSHIEYVFHPTLGKNGIHVITKHTKYDMETDTWANPCYICEEDKQSFIAAWCQYRAELESPNNKLKEDE